MQEREGVEMERILRMLNALGAIMGSPDLLERSIDAALLGFGRKALVGQHTKIGQSYKPEGGDVRIDLSERINYDRSKYKGRGRLSTNR